jgi:hypothetical protein
MHMAHMWQRSTLAGQRMVVCGVQDAAQWLSCSSNAASLDSKAGRRLRARLTYFHEKGLPVRMDAHLQGMQGCGCQHSASKHQHYTHTRLLQKDMPKWTCRACPVLQQASDLQRLKDTVAAPSKAAMSDSVCISLLQTLNMKKLCEKFGLDLHEALRLVVKSRRQMTSSKPHKYTSPHLEPSWQGLDKYPYVNKGGVLPPPVPASAQNCMT